MIPYEKVKEMCLSIGLVETNDMQVAGNSNYHFFAIPYDINEDGINPILVTYYSKFGCNAFLPNNERLAPSWVISEEKLKKVLEKLEEEICKYRKEQKLNSIRKSCIEFET